MTTDLQQTQARTAVTQDEIALIKNTVADGATDAELKLFLFDCARQNVHPLDRLIHFIKRKGKYTPITSIDFMRIRAADSGEMAGSDDPVFELNTVRETPYPNAATVTVYRMTQGQRFSYTATARWSEYYPGDGDIGFMWRKMPHTMLGKCAEALALRKGFPRQLAGLYAKEEMEQADAAPVTMTTAQASHGLRATPAQAADRDIQPSVPNGGDSGTPDVIDTETGAVLPPGFALIDDYKPDGDWHHFTWGRDAQGGWTVYRTRLAKVSNQGRVAFNDRVPVRLHGTPAKNGNGFYLDRVERLDGQDGLMSKADMAKTKWDPDQLEGQGF